MRQGIINIPYPARGRSRRIFRTSAGLLQAVKEEEGRTGVMWVWWGEQPLQARR